MVVAGEAEDGIAALEAFRTVEPDVVFLDIQIPGIHGIDLAATLSRMAEPPLIVFVTAYDSYAVRAFELNAIDYLLKPISEERFAATIRRIGDTALDREGKYREYLHGLRALVREYAASCEDAPDDASEDGAENASAKPQSEYLTIYKDGRYFPLQFKKIACLKAEGGATRVFGETGEYLVYRPLHEFEEALPEESFFQAHRSYIINLCFIQHIDLWINGALQIELRNVNERIPVSRGKTKELKRRMNMK
jgi:two-component system LytT family response regulator/two-component system response regulator LytT